MPLSEHEQRLLDQIEQALYAEDPKFASTVRSAGRRSHTRRSIILAVIGVLAGFAIVIVGLAANLIPLGVVGFVLIVAACGYGVTVLRARSTASSGSSERSPKTKNQTGLRARMEERLRRRFDES